MMCLVIHDQAWADDALRNRIDACTKAEDDRPQEAIDMANQLLETIDLANQPLLYVEVLGCLGWSHATNNQADLARIQAANMEQHLDKMLPEIATIRLYRRAGGVFHRAGDRVSATENYAKAMKIAEKYELVVEQIPLLVNLGVLHSEIREHTKAIDDYYLALDLMEKIDDFRYQPPVLFNLGVTLNGQDRFDEALKIFKQVEAMINEHWPEARVAQVHAGLAAAYSGLKEYQKGKEHATISADLHRKNKGSDYFNVLSNLANLELRLGDRETALQMAEEVLVFVQDPNNRLSILGGNNIVPSLAIFYERYGQTDQALGLLKLARGIDQELQDSFNQKQMAQMQARLSDSKQREELAVLKQQQEAHDVELLSAQYIRNIQLLVGGFLVTILLLFLFWQYRSNGKLRAMSLRDTLTRLGNRRALFQWIQANPEPKPGQERLLWLIDLDHFKQVNDSYGHDAGDQTLIRIARTLQQVMNPERQVVRWGGEEYLMITDDVAFANANGFGDELLKLIENTEIKTGLDRFSLTASIGLSRVQNGSQQAWNKALHEVDRALYVAKDRGRNCMAIVSTIQ